MASSSADSRPTARGGLDVRAFHGLVYRQQDPDHLARVTSPAYDLVTAAGRDRLAAVDPHNIVRLILPRVEAGPVVPGTHGAPADAEPVDSARQAAGTLRDWLTDGVLDRTSAPGLWRYEMRGPGAATTTGWLGAVTLPAPGSDAVLPHEDTYAPAVEGRRALLAATGTDLEPIVLAHDADDELAELTTQAGLAAPDMEVADPDGVSHRLWAVTDPEAVAALTRALGRTSAVIADGHHRFAAARAHSRSGAPGSDSVLALLTPMGPGGLRVHAIHRVLPDLPLGAATEAARAGFRTRELATPAGVPDAVRSWLDREDAAGFLLTDGDHVVVLDQPTPEVLAAVPGEAPAAWRRLDVVLAHHGLITGLWGRPDDPSSVLIAHDVAEALGAARERQGTALLLRSPSPAGVAAVARAGARMPRKSTLFVPKPRTGLVLRPHLG
ncbi:DUF1015 family protein [Modestobacter sp. I12A-02628]|uniref:DUF1015 family protein n=1 Tax=Goekera deserti TaxID=2497753 RepID=A0A7K3WEI7_9ACTN|nr:DUF1015 domain-containing protein [Goekera deserti]MPQ99765.1 DUF1015 family protein [Goekera deserti]NDI46224.1 DUF1015 family protein [Goekera deserti]NEL54844.1 DUF1015 family protein [Goekera deserti]